MTKRDAQTLDHMAANSPSEAEMVLKQAVDLRETIYRIFSTITAGSMPNDVDLVTFNGNLSRASLRSRIIKTKDGLSWDWTGNKDTLDWMLNPIIRSAADLLVSDDLKRVKRCADPRCGWLFLDVSRNKTRRWCDMKDCGNRAKASRFYQRKKQA
jgi:predicted RNA-binding Zn ribbon-like protein